VKLETKLRREIEKHHLVSHGETLVVAVSGGADSVALLHALLRLTEGWQVTLHVAHLNHLLRGEEGAADADFVRRLADSYQLQWTVESLDVAAWQRQTGLGLEEAARQARYSFLRRTAEEVGAAGILTAHHRDDQAETVLLHLLRGSGPEGLAGMAPREGDLRRPFLTVSKAEILAYCRESSLPYRTDASNLLPLVRRNQLRLHLLPSLAEYNPRIAAALGKAAEICRAENDLLAELAGKAYADLSRRRAADVCLEMTGLDQLPLALQRRVLRLAYDQLAGTQGGLSFEQTEALRFLGSGKILSLPGGIRASRIYGEMTLGPIPAYAGDEASGSADCSQLKAWPLAVPGRTEIPALGLAVTCQIVDRRAAESAAGPMTAFFSLAAASLPLTVRSRLPGDRFRPLGMAGEKKLKAYFIDAKIPRPERGRIPLLLAGSRIIWLVGCRLAADLQPGDQDKQVLLVRVEKV